MEEFGMRPAVERHLCLGRRAPLGIPRRRAIVDSRIIAVIDIRF